jgi:hypothetical protein
VLVVAVALVDVLVVVVACPLAALVLVRRTLERRWRRQLAAPFGRLVLLLWLLLRLVARLVLTRLVVLGLVGGPVLVPVVPRPVIWPLGRTLLVVRSGTERLIAAG